MKDVLKDPDFQKKLLRINAILPAALLAMDLVTGRLGANPPEAIIRTTGVMAILFLVLGLAITPLAKKMKWPWLIRHRRALGLFAFFYASVHLLAYTLFDKGGQLREVFADIQKRPFILLGFLAFLLMVPLAITSTNEMIKRLGPKRWKNLHRLTYGIAVLAVMHFWLIVKSDIFYPLLFGVALALLFATRIPDTKKS